MAEKNKIQDQRIHLLSRINNFHNRAEGIFETVDQPDAIDVNPADLFKLALKEQKEDNTVGDEEQGDEAGKNDEADSEGSDIEDDAPEDRLVCAEDMALRLPSSTCRYVQRRSAGFERIMKMELRLREGQANDSLSKLRLALGEKSLLYVTKVRTAANYSNRSRAWKDVNNTSKTVSCHANTYRIARVTMKELGADNDSMTRYQALQRKDLRVSADVVQANRIGQRSETLPWIWRLNLMGEEAGANTNWMKECSSLLCLVEK